MNENALKVHLPRLPNPEFFAVPEHSIRTACGQALLSYDRATGAGFVYNIQTNSWMIHAPVGFEVFAMLVAGAGYAIPAGDEAQRWFESCSGISLSAAALH